MGSPPTAMTCQVLNQVRLKIRRGQRFKGCPYNKDEYVDVQLKYDFFPTTTQAGVARWSSPLKRTSSATES